LDIGLSPGFIEQANLTWHMVSPALARQLLRIRNPFAHKGHFGHSLLVAGSYGKMGAAILAAKACLHSGSGLLTCYLPSCGFTIMQTAVPEAMVLTDSSDNILSELPSEIEKYDAIGIGPGIGTADPTQKLISFLVRRSSRPMVIDADGLNCLAAQKELLDRLPAFTVLTPHPREFDRLFGEHADDFSRMKTAEGKAKELNLVLILKGHHSMIATPSGHCYFNCTGNPGMAKGGSGDVLTGILTSFLAQGYESVPAAILATYLHGFAGDLAAEELSKEYMTPLDLIQNLSPAFLSLYPS
jgi:NAD(P)H-hydrate epimerase